MPTDPSPTHRIFLVGLPGSGKSTLGRVLASDLNWPFVDLDEALESRTGRSVAHLFQEEGETAFRRLEADLLRHEGLATPLVLATGGGTPCFHDSMSWLLTHGQVVWLDVPPNLIARRLLSSRHPLSQRPLLSRAAQPEASPQATDWPLADILNQTLSARRAFYGRAPFRCAGPGCTSADVRRLLKLPA